MVLQRWYPIADARRAEQRTDRVWRGFGPFRGPLIDVRVRDWSVPVDVVEEGDNIVVRASVPGVKPEDIDVTIENGVLAVKGSSASEKEGTEEGGYLIRERRTGSFSRSLRLPETVDSAKAESRYEYGTLTISFPKQEASKAKRLEVKTAA